MTQTALPLSTTVPRKIGTFTALRQANFRLYFIGQLISMSGTWMQAVAQGYLVFSLTKSELWLGIVACAAGAPMLLIAPFGGVLVERMNRRRLLIITQTVQMTLAFILATLVFTDAVQIWHIVTLALLLGTTNAFDAPARQTIISDLVGKDLIVSGIAMNSIIVNGSRVFGPTIAGIFLTTFGPAWCFLLNGLSFLAVIGMLSILQLEGVTVIRAVARPLVQLAEGLRYARQTPVVRGILLMAMNGGFFGWAILTLFPAFSDVVLNSPEKAYAIISAANGLGAVVGGLLVSNVGQKIGRGRLLSISALGAPLFVFLFSRTTIIPLAALMCMMIGFCLIVYFVTLNMTLQTTIPADFRGRILSLYTLCIIGLNPFGALLLGLVAQKIGSPNALAFYACMFVVFSSAVLIKSPALRRLQ